MTAFKFLLSMLVIAALIASPAYAMVPASMLVHGKTMDDFKQYNQANKPSVAWRTFHQYKILEKAPRPTLGILRIRMAPNEMKTLGDYERFYSGRKASTAFRMFHQPSRHEKPEIMRTLEAPTAGSNWRQSKGRFIQLG